MLIVAVFDRISLSITRQLFLKSVFEEDTTLDLKNQQKDTETNIYEHKSFQNATMIVCNVKNQR